MARICQPQPVTERLLTTPEIAKADAAHIPPNEQGRPSRHGLQLCCGRVMCEAQDAKTATFFEQRIQELEAMVREVLTATDILGVEWHSWNERAQQALQPRGEEKEK